MKEETVTLHGVSTRVLRLAGTGPTVLLVHGFTDSADTWRGVLQELARRGRAAVAIDLPGHGRATSLPASPGLEEHDVFLRAAVDFADDGAGVLIVGNSLGALLALRAVDRDARSITGVLALAPPGDSVALPLRLLPGLWPVLRHVLRLAPVPVGLLRLAAGHTFVAGVAGGRLEPSVRRAYASHLDRSRLHELFAACAEMMSEITHPDPTTLRSLSGPVTLWWGSKDRVCPASGATRFGSDSRVVLTPGASHSPQLRHPELVVRLLVDHETYAAQRPELP